MHSKSVTPELTVSGASKSKGKPLNFYDLTSIEEFASSKEQSFVSRLGTA